ncbi:MAG: hypothetical protein K5882_05135 [Bacteroidales bacterium]|nr:hypothetical protein [Bacteroidales bacterium]
MRKNTEQFDNGHIMLRNRPDKGEALGRVIALGFVLFIVFILYAAMHNTWPDDDRLEQFMSFAAFLLIAAIPLYLCFVLLVKIYWYAFGGETVYYSDSAIYIEQKKAIQREVVIPWESITKVEPYEEPLICMLLPTQDPKVLLTYKVAEGKTRKIHFGFGLNKQQQTYVVKRINELLVESFE